jgi:hypothetical protein
MQVSASKIVRSLVTLSTATTGKRHTVFNDSRSFGRSIKIWGWGDADYANAVTWLRAAGYKVRTVRTRKIHNPGWCMSRGENTRLWIYA